MLVKIPRARSGAYGDLTSRALTATDPSFKTGSVGGGNSTFRAPIGRSMSEQNSNTIALALKLMARDRLSSEESELSRRACGPKLLLQILQPGTILYWVVGRRADGKLPDAEAAIRRVMRRAFGWPSAKSSAIQGAG